MPVGHEDGDERTFFFLRTEPLPPVRTEFCILANFSAFIFECIYLEKNIEGEQIALKKKRMSANARPATQASGARSNAEKCDLIY
jgi:hypothetical protein